LLSSALDLVLLGVIPAVLMAVVVDSLFKFAVSILETTRR
jgi:osmoprotectant transport system permease protein